MSHCGAYRYFISETSYWIPGGWVRWGGCRRWNDGYWAWRPVVQPPGLWHNLFLLSLRTGGELLLFAYALLSRILQ